MYSFYHTIGVHVLISVWCHFRAISGTHVHHPNIPIVVSLDFFFFFFFTYEDLYIFKDVKILNRGYMLYFKKYLQRLQLVMENKTIF